MFENGELVENLDVLRRFAMRLTGNVSDGEDLLHSTVLRAIEKKALFEPGSNLLGWASKIMFNIFVSQYRRKTKFETKFDPDSFLEKESVAAAQETIMEVSEVAEAMNQLSSDHRQILIMICAEGQKYEEVAKSLNIPVGTVRSRLARARNNLHLVMERPTPETRFLPAVARPIYEHGLVA